MSELMSVLQSRELKDAFETEYGGTQAFTSCTIYDITALENFIAVAKAFLETQNTEEKKTGIAAYFGLTTEPLRGTTNPDIVVPGDRLTVFLAPVLFEEDFEEDNFPGNNPTGQRRIIKQGSLVSLFGSGSAQFPINDTDLLSFDISQNTP